MNPGRAKARVVFDCMVFLQGAARRESPSAACLLLAELGVVELCVSNEILSEVWDVLTRPSIQQRFPALTEALVDKFLTALGKHSVLISPVPRLFMYERDPKDEPYINLAIAAGASYLVSRDGDILDLGAHESPDGARVRSHIPDLQILDPVSFLAALRHPRSR
jgi:putative PIN family toxin of toxin-antitoxin system